MKRTARHLVGLLCIAFVTAGCGSAVSDAALDQVRKALDTADYATAVTKADTAFAADPTNFELTMLRSSAYAGRAGVVFLDLITELTSTTSSATEFKSIHDVFVKTFSSTGLDALRTAITTLSGFAGDTGTAGSSKNKRYSYQLGAYQLIEAFALPTLRAKPASTSTVTVTNITEADQGMYKTILLRPTATWSRVVSLRITP